MNNTTDERESEKIKCKSMIKDGKNCKLAICLFLNIKGNQGAVH